jgi:hypothetical protein
MSKCEMDGLIQGTVQRTYRGEKRLVVYYKYLFINKTHSNTIVTKNKTLTSNYPGV